MKLFTLQVYTFEKKLTTGEEDRMLELNALRRFETKSHYHNRRIKLDRKK